VSAPIAWIVRWSAHADGTPAGQARYTIRREARGFYMIRKASGFDVSITPEF
jgi:hypothetical protein